MYGRYTMKYTTIIKIIQNLDAISLQKNIQVLTRELLFVPIRDVMVNNPQAR